MIRTVGAAFLVVATVCVGCARQAGEQPAAQAPAEQPAAQREQSPDSSIVASEGFETGKGETLQEADETTAGQPAKAP